ncbi:RING finger protein 17-like isoform X2 [Dendropsophus ebraccatus]|uniref:RING finger protein 17-like isoform X2 n=1 Tax=Dendropsophus ebraccatus TaxID=150705 RepID=UPI0038321655
MAASSSIISRWGWDGCIETFPCGHCLCSGCCGRMAALPIACPVCAEFEPKDCGVFTSLRRDLQEALSPLQLSPNVDSGTTADDNCGSKKTPAVNENKVVPVMDTENAFSGDCQVPRITPNDNHCLKIDEALATAKSTLHHLDSVYETLKELEAKHKQQEESLSSSVNEAYEKLLLTVNIRKSDLLKGLRRRWDVFTIEMQNAVTDIEKQRKCLETRVAFAEALKRLPSMSVYCEINNLLADLKTRCNNEATLDSLKGSSDIRFTVDCNTALKTLDSIGAVCLVGGSKFQQTPDVTAASREPYCSDDAEELLKDVPKRLVYEEHESDTRCVEIDGHKVDATSQLASGDDSQTSQGSGLMSVRSKVLPRPMSTPDVIIEEIIQEDQQYPRRPQYTTSPDREKPLKKDFSQKTMGAHPPFYPEKTSQEPVYISHWIDPCNFYVHRVFHKRQIILLERELSSLGWTSRQCYPTDVVEIGEVIAFRSIPLIKWCRGTIVEMVPLESKCSLTACGPARYKIEDIKRLTLFLLDYGGTETFIARQTGSCVMNIRLLEDYETEVKHLHKMLTKLSFTDDKSVMVFPPLAVHCSLDIHTKSEDGLLKKQIKEYVTRVIGNKCVSMKVFREEDNKLIVDLKTACGNNVPKDMPMSLHDALVSMELARFPSNVSRVLSDTATSHYKDPVLPWNKSEVVIICHFNDPSDFYIHALERSDYGMIVEKLQEVYNSKEADDLQMYCPSVGQPCVAKYNTEDDHWYRAEIKALLNPFEAVIKYVDFGSIGTVNIADLKSLKDEFMTLPCQAIGCRLAHIHPLSAAPGWSPEACALFQELTFQKQLKCTFLDLLPEDKLPVLLFDYDQSKMASVNVMLVEGNVAFFSPGTSGPADRDLPVKEVWDPVLDITSDSGEMSLFERKEHNVFISHVVSPSKIYVRGLTTENLLMGLQAGMFDHYEKSEPEATNWQVDMMVAVLLQSDPMCWVRGKIINVLSERLVEVFCCDFGMQEVMDVANLRTLDESFMIYEALCLECTLVDIQPAGRCQEWTAAVCDFLTCHLSGAVVTIVIEDNVRCWPPLPVRIVSKNEAGEMVDVSDLLVKKGLALRDRRINKRNSLLEAPDTRTRLPDIGFLQEQDPEEDYEGRWKPELTKTVTREPSIGSEAEEPSIEEMAEDPYLPPLLPDEESFPAKVCHVAEDGTIYVVQGCLEKELKILMADIQNSFTSLGLVAPHSWRKGEGCLIKGSDTKLYRGKVLNVFSGDMVQYEDFGYTEKIPQCHLYPSVYDPHTPGFCIPCRLDDIHPEGDRWLPEAIQLLKELLLERVVTVHFVEPPKFPRGIASVRIYCGSASVSALLGLHGYGIRRQSDNNDKIEISKITKNSREKLWSIDLENEKNKKTPLLPPYTSESLPPPGEIYKVEVTHLQTPNDVFIRLKKNGSCGTSDSADGGCNSLKYHLEKVNSKETELTALKDFRTAMPCLAGYRGGLLHRARLQSIKSYDPITCAVEFVDHGHTAVLETSSLFQLPPPLIEYPTEAIRVRLAGFRPPAEDHQSNRVVYCTEWSLKALYKMMDLVKERTLYATSLAGSDNTIFLYDDNWQLLHIPLISEGLAELQEV